MKQQHFVTFYSPGTFVAEATCKPIDAWDTALAMKIADEITERHGATPYGFRFSTRERGDDDLDSKQAAMSPMHYLGGKVETLAEVEARDDPKESVLRSNMRINGYSRIIVNDNSWRWTQPLNDGDIVLNYTPPSRRGAA